MNLNSILLGSEDPSRLMDYYARLFGEPGWEGGDFSGWQIGIRTPQGGRGVGGPGTLPAR
jgi:hypothetical protein